MKKKNLLTLAVVAVGAFLFYRMVTKKKGGDMKKDEKKSNYLNAAGGACPAGKKLVIETYLDNEGNWNKRAICVNPSEYF